jgi:hypothetical protein
MLAAIAHPDPDQKIDGRPGCPAEERDGIAQPDQRSRKTSLERIGKIYDRADVHYVITSTSIEQSQQITPVPPRTSGK